MFKASKQSRIAPMIIVRYILHESVSLQNSVESEKSMLTGEFWAVVGKKECAFEIDSGANETVVHKQYYDPDLKLYKAKCRLIGAEGILLNCVGVQKMPIKYKNTLIQKVYLIRKLYTSPLLGKPVIKAFDLNKRTNKVLNSKNFPEEK